MKTFQRDRLRNMEHFQFADRVLKLCKDAGVEKLTEVLPPLEAALAREDEALNRTRALDGTEALEKLDRKRDNAYYALRLLVEMELRNDDESVVEAAKTVAEVMRRYPDTPEVNYDQETGNIKNMVGDFKKAAAAVTKSTPQLPLHGSIRPTKPSTNAITSAWCRKRPKARSTSKKFAPRWIRRSTAFWHASQPSTT